MKCFRCFAFLLGLAGLGFAAPMLAESKVPWEINALTPDGTVDYDLRTGIASATNGISIRYGNALLVAERASVDRLSGWVVADGAVRIENEGQIWVGEHLSYNFLTRQMTAEQFRTGKAPVYLSARSLAGGTSNGIYYATNALVTTDDSDQPFQTIRAKSVTIVAGEYVTARHAVVYVGGIPVFYLPYFSRPLKARANYWTLMPGFRTKYGAFMVGTYNWYLGENIDGSFHATYRSKRGPEVGVNANGDFGRWGTPSIEAAYLYDDLPENEAGSLTFPHERGIAFLSYQSEPWTNFFVKSQIRYTSDSDVLQEFFEGSYRQNPQPSTYFNFQKLWQNWSLDTIVSPRINDYLNTVERLPEIKLTGLRQQIGATPVYYQSVSSAGYLERVFAVTDGLTTPGTNAFRGDTWHQLILPQTFFGFLNVEPRAGGRYTYYSEANGPGAGPFTTAESRWVFNTGMEANFKAARVWPAARSKLLDVDGVRHIIQPWANYAYIPEPSVPIRKLPQFDYLNPSLSLLPIEFPDYNAIDDVAAQNVVRFGVNNKVQTKREGQIETLLNLTVFVDSYLTDRPLNQRFSDIATATVFRPRSWLTLESESLINPQRGQFDLATQTLALTPNSTWSFGLTYYYLRDNYEPLPIAWGQGSKLLSGSISYRFSPEWGMRIYEYYDLVNGRLGDQAYTVYRDFRSWTGAFVARIRNNGGGDVDWSLGFVVSLKAHPSYKAGQDSVGRYGLLGY
jgi:LPS-assembly protein